MYMHACIPTNTRSVAPHLSCYSEKQTLSYSLLSLYCTHNTNDMVNRVPMLKMFSQRRETSPLRAVVSIRTCTLIHILIL